MKDNIINETPYNIYESDIINICNLIFKKYKIDNPVFNIVFVSKDKIREINKTYRNKDDVTDVISFAFEEESRIKYDNIRFLGEIYISAQRAQEQAKEYGHSIKREICYLTTHGFLHLLGYDHILDKDKEIMRKEEESILKEYDINR
ncbi:MAG: rRNA maturation RNase YbeY [Bacilli bacterium]